MTHASSVVKSGFIPTSTRTLTKWPTLVTAEAMPMTLARILRSRMTVTRHVRF